MSDQSIAEQIIARILALTAEARTKGTPALAAEAITLQAELMQLVISAPTLHWAPTDEGAVHVDPFPNPDVWAIAEFGPLKVAVWCGPKGLGIGPNH